MVSNSAQSGPPVGAHVKVPWGLDQIDGVVTERYGHGPLAQARVRVAIRGADGEDLDFEEFSLPLDSLTLVG